MEYEDDGNSKGNMIPAGNFRMTHSGVGIPVNGACYAKPCLQAYDDSDAQIRLHIHKF